MRCTPEPNLNIGFLWTIRGSIQMDPDYQRDSGIWPLEKRQLFVDSVFNGYDIPKLYFHGLGSDESVNFQYAVVDGKQRLQTLFDFLEDGFPLGEFDKMDPDAMKSVARQIKTPPDPGKYFSQLSGVWKEYFRSRSLPIVVVDNAEVEDIENLFSRLNNGEPLTGAEKRNAMPGDMSALVREIGNDPFFKQWAPIRKRYQHYEAAAKFLLMEQTMLGTTRGRYCDLKKRFLDAMVREGRKMAKSDREKLCDTVKGNMKFMKRLFKKGDPLLKKPTSVPLCYAFCAEVAGLYAHPQLSQKVHGFLEWFQTERLENRQRPEEKWDTELVEFDRLVQLGNDKESMRERVRILTARFLQRCPDVQIKDKRRHFLPEERFAIWIIGKKQCAECEKPIALNEMDADHHRKWAEGGPTTLANGRCLCTSCNRANQRAA